MVFTLTLRMAAISFVLLPSAMSWRISRWRGVKYAGGFGFVAGTGEEVVDDALADDGTEVGVPLGHGLERQAKFLGGGVLDQVTGSAALEGLDDIFLIGVHGKDQDLHVREIARDAGRDVQSIEAFHGHVDNGDVRIVFLDEVEGFAAIAGFGDDLH